MTMPPTCQLSEWRRAALFCRFGSVWPPPSLTSDVGTNENRDNTPSNLIPTIFAGPLVRPGNYYEMNLNAANPYVGNPSDPGIETPTGTAMNHWNVLSTIEDFYGLAHIGNSVNRPRVQDAFALQPRPPTLNIQTLSDNAVMVYWPYPSAEFNLQQNTSLITTTWVAPGESVPNNGTIKYIVVLIPGRRRNQRSAFTNGHRLAMP